MEQMKQTPQAQQEPPKQDSRTQQSSAFQTQQSAASQEPQTQQPPASQTQTNSAATASASASASTAPDDIYALQDPTQKRGRKKAAAPQVEKTPEQKRRTKRIIGAIVAVLIVAVGAYFAWDTLREPDYSAYANYKITLCGITDQDIVTTPAQLAQLDCVLQTVSGTGSGTNGESKLGSTACFGPTLDTILAQYGCKQTDFRRIVVRCKEELDSNGSLYQYEVVLRGETLNNPIIMSIAKGKNPLAEYETPCRMVVPSEATGKWAYGVIKITFER